MNRCCPTIRSGAQSSNMPIRSALLRVLFWSLALAAVFGAMGILFGSHDALWRVAATSIATAFAALLFLGCSSTMEKPVSRPAALLAAALIVIEYLLILGAIWVEDLAIGYGPYEESLWLTILFLALVGIPAIVSMRMTKTALTAMAGRTGLALAAVEMLMLLIVAWDQSPWGQIEELAGWLPPYALLVVVSLVGQGSKPRRPWRWAGVAAAFLGYSLIVYGIINQIHHGGEVVVYVTCLAAVLAHANVVLLCPLRPAQMWLRWSTLSAGVATSFFVALSTYIGQNGDSMNSRFAGASGIIAGCGTLALLIQARLDRRFVVPLAGMTGVSAITVICPICRKKQTLALGGAACADCHALIHVSIEEPKCATCGYSLLMLQSGICPECGTPVRACRPVVRVDHESNSEQ
jgi:hypothetical protein